ncbi:MAG: hypothetical protein GY870_20465 [archaeon]|nr:hypothetical protein [archaeon]
MIILLHLWIIDRLSSTSVFYRNYSDGIKIDPDLVSGLLSALHNFSEIELQHNQGIESILMGGLNWVYVDNKDINLLFICADDRRMDPNITKSRLEVIQNAFIQEFNITVKNWKEDYHGGINRFEKFYKTSDLLLEQWREAEKVTSSAELFDLLGIFQQIFNLYINIIKLNIFNESYKTIIKEIKTTIKNLLISEKINEDSEIYKISFDEHSGWNIFTVNPLNIKDAGLLRKFLLLLTEQIRDLIAKKLGKMLVLDSFNKEIFPFILNNWNLVQKLKIERNLLSIFLQK